MKKLFAICFGIIFFAVLFHVFQYNQNKNLPKINDGFMDLSNWNYDEENSIVLSGKWNFYWKKLIYDDKNYPKDASVNVPNYWNNININGSKLSGKGFATYRLRIKAKKGENFYLNIPPQNTAYRLIISGQEIAHTGRVSENASTAVPEYKTLSANFTAPSEEFYINLQVSNYTAWYGGFKNFITIGSQERITQITQINTLTRYLTSGIVLTLVLFFLIIFFTANRDKSFLYISLSGISIIIEIFFGYEYEIKNFFPSMTFHFLLAVYYIGFYWLLTPLLLFLSSNFKKRYIKFISHIFAAIAIIFTVLTVILPLNIFCGFTRIYSFLLLSHIIFIIFILFKEFSSGNNTIFPMLVSSILFLLATINDLLLAYKIYRIIGINLVPIAILIFLFSVVFVIARQYIRNYNKNKELLDEIIYLDTVKDEFLVNITKELRTPVNSIIVATEKFKASTYKHIESPPELKTIEQIHSNSLRVLDMLNNIMIYSKLQYGGLKFNKGAFSISTLLKGIVSEYSYSIGTDIIYTPLENSNGTLLVYADRSWISRVIYNLFNICLRHTENGNNILVKTKVEHKKVYIHIYFSGMPLETMELIQRHFIDGKKNSTMPDNLGVSVYIIKYIIENHNNIVSIEPTYSGYKFIFTLDIVDEKLLTGNNTSSFEDLSKNNVVTSGISFTADGANKTAVIIASDIPNIRAISEALSQIGFSAKGFIIAKKALNYIENEKDIDIVIVEAAMPDISGFEICSCLREKYTLLELPIVIITSRNQSESVIQSFKAGANDCVFEPYDIVELRSRINTLYSLKQAVSMSIENEMAFLQAQIKPHFLFNVLNTITAYCYIDPEASAKLIENLSMYLRYSFDFDPSKKEFLLCDEIEFTQNYLDIEKARFEDLIDYEFDIEDADNIYVPPFIIQPLVENAVKHGILKKPDGGKILISGNLQENKYIIKIQDDGIGMEKSKLDAVISGKIADGTGTGLKNIRKRLNHTYNTDLLIESIPGRGTKVTLILKIS